MKKLLIIAILLGVLSVQARDFGNVFVSKAIKVRDGDTIVVNVDNWPPIVGQNIAIRIADINTPELRTKDPKVKKEALEATERLKKALANANTIVLKKVRRGKYFRIVAELWIDNQKYTHEKYLITKK